jgi:ribosomal protein L37AE/L43A
MMLGTPYIMDLVRCPRCKTEHRLAPGASGYTCAGCGTAWLFVQCAQCHGTFHAAAGLEAWTCSRCGHRNVAPPEVAAAPRVGPRRQAPTGWQRLTPKGKLALVLVPIVIAGIVIGFLLAGGGGGGGPAGNAKLAAAHRSYCHDLTVLQIGFRPDALGRFLNKMKRDISLYRAAGDKVSVDDLKEIQSAAQDLLTALQNNRGTGSATTRLEQAISKGPTC